MTNDKYSFRKQILTCEQILDMIKSGTLRFVGQTYGTNSKWSVGLKSLFIFQLLSGLQVPELMFDGSSSTWHVVSGERQLMCIRDYVNGKLQLSKEVFNRMEKMIEYQNLPLTLKRKLLNTEFTVKVLNPGISSLNRYQIYEMIGASEGSCDMWAVARFVFQEGYQQLELIVDRIIQNYPNVKKNRKQLLRLPLLWMISDKVEEQTKRVAISDYSKIDSILIPLLEMFYLEEYKIEDLIAACSFLSDDSASTIFSCKSMSLRTVTLILLLRDVNSGKELSTFIRSCHNTWKKMPQSLRSPSYTMLVEQIDYMSQKLKL